MTLFIKPVKESLLKHALGVPLPGSISYFWNMGSLLGLCLVIQLLSGVFLTFHYSSYMGVAFESVIDIMEEVSSGWFIRFVHANGASFFFICMYVHVARGLYYKSFIHKGVWTVGVLIMFLLMGTAFLGYVLPWGQMSFWGATVITNLLSAFPKGEEMVQWIWGGFSVSGPTLTRFFSLHFILPFVILALSSVHILLLHTAGSSNPLGVESNSDKIYFHPYFTTKDLLGAGVMLLILFHIIFVNPDLFMDPDNFIPANPMATPPHIQPEWYFLFAYAILRSIPNKLGGVIALVLSIACLFLLPLSSGQMGGVFSMVWKVKIFTFFSLFILLTWVGSMPVSSDLVPLGQICSIMYFLNFSLMMV